MREVLLAANLLDRQILDRAGIPLGKVDDVELRRTRDGVRVSALLTGQRALGERFGGLVGRWITAVAERWDDDGDHLRRIPYELVGRVDAAVRLTVARDRLPEPALEAWLDTHLIGRIPGAGRDD
ncbi:hypothetical protein O7606_06615 [Micromonospora sp. WMMD882]|uniref:hypothetical protein n=1 Tax=Micromonospora sp. WMMD882 TaxID=3015151 RepID=UPI00248D327E|nr:hypothetical protein [Micromonospora sp. WMMD882]WBB81050.1 hypothetical protein O7606_06615 [Micromonospora sp. WMMD882]